MSRTPKAESVRKERVPVASRREPLKYKGLDTQNFVQRWVLERDDRIEEFLAGGYEFVKPTGQGTVVGDPTVNSSSGIDTRVTKSAGFGGLRLILMQIPIEFYKEDQASKQREVDQTEDTMQRPGTGKAVPQEGVDYGKITMKRTHVNKDKLDD